ncbi:alpha-amylase family glycosyl hydrolase [Actinospongicola halichondriae]|uniref:alpha-amylase family glycosyl hydrolase n=1 Tax=Actinospongicola halichondriae TaxID=3236844 RepID=UPI003D3F2EA2
MPTSDQPWWKTAVFYQIYPRSFADGNGDGVGDLAGIASHLDHLVDLGIDAVWLSPFYESPMRDYGYDISDHCAVDPVFGDLDDFDRVLVGLHDRGIKVIVDFVPNHVSSDHPWFVEARSDRASAKRDWFIWADPKPDGGPPTNWTASFTDESAWEFDESTGQYYLHLFLPEQPDVNWENPDAEAAQHDVLRFWLDRGVDGFRMDVLNAIGKDPEPRDVPDSIVGLPHVVLTHHETAMPLIRRIRDTVDAAGDTFVIGEIVTGDVELQASYQGDGDGVHCSVNFASVWAPWERSAWFDLITSTEAAYPHDGPRWPSYVLSNHDNPRHRTRFGGYESRARAAAVLLLTLRGTPFLYAGEELGLEDAEIPEDRVVDPGGRDGCRAPIPWVGDPGHGWGPDAWLPFPPDAGIRNAEAQKAGEVTMFDLYRSVLAARRASPALQAGSLELLDLHPEVLSFRRVSDDDQRMVHVNFSDDVAEIEASGELVVSAAGATSGTFDGHLPGGAALVVRP